MDHSFYNSNMTSSVIIDKPLFCQVEIVSQLSQIKFESKFGTKKQKIDLKSILGLRLTSFVDGPN